MTNRERIAKEAPDELIKEMDDYASCAGRRYLDMEAWLESEDREYIPDGPPAVLEEPDGRESPGFFVDSTTRFDTPYGTILMKGDKLHEWQIILAPMKQIKVTGEGGAS